MIDTVMPILEGIWKRRWLALGVAWACAIVAAVIVPRIPERYEAKARIYVDTQSVLKPLMADLAFQPDIDQQVHMLSRTVISRPNLEKLVDSPELGLLRQGGEDREAAIARLTRQIQIQPGETGLYTIAYRDRLPQVAEAVVEAVLKLFVNLSSDVKRRDSEDASRFIAEQIASYEEKLAIAENKLKDFRVRNMAVLGVPNQDFFARITTTSEELDKLRRDLAAAEQASLSYRRNLNLTVGEDPRIAAIEAELTTQRKQLNDLGRRFTDQHPDVVSTRALIANLDAELQRLRSARPRAEGELPAVTGAANERVQGSLADADAQVASLRSRVALEQQKLEQLRSLAGRVPQVDAELAQLNRDYEVIRRNYEQLVSRRESAALGVKLDESAKLADYRVVEPPRVADRPVFPSRRQIAALAMAAALLLGLAVPIGLDVLRPTFADTRALQRLTGRPVMGTISVSPAAHGPARRGLTAAFTLSLLLLVAAQAAWLGWVTKLAS